MWASACLCLHVCVTASVVSGSHCSSETLYAHARVLCTSMPISAHVSLTEYLSSLFVHSNDCSNFEGPPPYHRAKSFQTPAQMDIAPVALEALDLTAFLERASRPGGLFLASEQHREAFSRSFEDQLYDELIAEGLPQIRDVLQSLPERPVTKLVLGPEYACCHDEGSRDIVHAPEQKDIVPWCEATSVPSPEAVGSQDRENASVLRWLHVYSCCVIIYLSDSLTHTLRVSRTFT